MKSKRHDSPVVSVSSRRQFLQASGVAGIALAGGLGSRDSHSHSKSLSVEHTIIGEFKELPSNFVYMNSGTEGSMPAAVLSTFQRGLKRWASDPTTSYETDVDFGKRQERNRERVGKYLNVGKNNICLTSNTTMGLSMALMGLNIRSEDRVIISSHEHTAIRSPLHVLKARQGLRIVTRSFPPAQLLNKMNASELIDALFPNIAELKGARALAVSHVYPTTGVRLPLQALRDKVDELGIEYLIVDGAQAMGMLDLTAVEDCIEHCDFYACPGHKWLNGPPGTGVLYIRNADIRPPEFYPTISQRMEEYIDCNERIGDCFPIAEALQVRGCSNAPGFSAMIAALDFTERNGGAARFEQHILDLSQDLKKFLLAYAPHSIVSPHVDDALSSGLTVFFPFRWDDSQEIFTDEDTAAWVVSELLKRDIQVRFIGFQDARSADKSYAIRVSTAYFNTRVQLDRLKEALRDVLGCPDFSR